MLFDLVTLFPDLFDSFLRSSLIGKALSGDVLEIRLVNIRDFTSDRHRTADDRPYGGGPGMVLVPEPLARAIEFARGNEPEQTESRTVLLSPAGRPFDQSKAKEYAALDHLILVCGRYEGVDERICQTLIDEEISLGDFILSGGEVPAMAVIEAVARLLPGFLGAADSVNEETFSDGLLEYPQYTRPDSFRGLDVPEVLLSGNHGAINTWRRRMRLRRTYERRPGLLAEAKLTDTDRKFLAKLDSEQESGAGNKKS